MNGWPCRVSWRSPNRPSGPGFDRAYPQTFLDYFRQISEFEPTRAAQYGIRHFCWVAVNPKEAENPPLSREVMQHMPEFFDKPTVLGVGEIGFHKTTRNEEAIFEEQLEMAIKYDQLVLIHTPHLQDKVRGTRRTLDVLRNERSLRSACGLITWKNTRFANRWRPATGSDSRSTRSRNARRNGQSICSNCTGAERILVNSSADWGPSDPFTLQECILEYRRRGHSLQEAIEVFHNNPCRFLGQNPKFDIQPIRS